MLVSGTPTPKFWPDVPAVALDRP